MIIMISFTNFVIKSEYEIEEIERKDQDQSERKR